MAKRKLDLVKNPQRFFWRRENRRRIFKRVTNALFVFRKLLRRRSAAELPPVPPELRIPKRDGYLFLKPEVASRFSFSQTVLASCRDIIASRKPSGPLKKGKDYFHTVLKKEDLVERPELLCFALDPLLLSVVADYLGEIPVLNKLEIMHSPANDEELAGSQLYHCDHDDLSQVKVFFHLSDVTAESGPVTLIPKYLSDELKRRLNYVFKGREGHILDGTFGDGLSANQEVQVTGGPGSLLLLDTSNAFHRGSRAPKQDRYMFYLQYVTINSFLYNPLARLMPGGLRAKLAPLPYSGLPAAKESSLGSAVLVG